MLVSMTEQLRRCSDIQSTLECLLGRTLELTSARFGDVQIMDWKAGYLEIKAQQGFQGEFLNFFERVRFMGTSACARALLSRDSVVIEDIVVDQQFAPCLEIVRRAGIRAVQSTPLISSSGALVGMVSTLFPTPHRPTDIQMRAIKEAALLAANAIILFRARARRSQLTDEVDSAITNRRDASSPAKVKADTGRFASSVIGLRAIAPACPPRSYGSVLLIWSARELR
jgi:GAF domain-containing protein